MENYASRNTEGFLAGVPMFSNLATSIVLPASRVPVAAHSGITPDDFSRILHELIDSELMVVNSKNIRIFDLPEIKRLVDATSGESL